MTEIESSLTQEEIYNALCIGLDPVLDSLKHYPKDSTTLRVSSIAMNYFDNNNLKISSDLFEQKNKIYPLYLKIPIYIIGAIATAIFLLSYCIYSLNKGYQHGNHVGSYSRFYLLSFCIYSLNKGYQHGSRFYNPQEYEIKREIPLSEQLKDQLITMSKDIAGKGIDKKNSFSVFADVSIELSCPKLLSSKVIKSHRCKIL